ILAADVRDVTSAGRGGASGERDDLLVAGVDAGIVLESRREPERTRLELPPEQRVHARDLLRSRVALVVLAHHTTPQRTMTGVRRNIDRRTDALESREEVR